MPLAGTRAFTLIELLVVVCIMVVAMAMIAPAFTGLKGGADITKADYDVAGVLQTARSYATANNTYVWVGFYEENGSISSTTPATPGTGTIVLSIVASRNGTMIYTPNSLPITSGSMTANLIQVNKLVKINNMHLKTAVAGDPVFPIGIPGSGGATMTFATRPAVSGTACQIGSGVDTGSSKAPFQYPLGSNMSSLPTAQYTFTTAIQFSPRGEARINDVTQPLQPVIEIGLQPSHGSTIASTNPNVAAVQITGIAGNVEIYRK